MLVDHERVLADLKGIIADKSAHGQRDLLAAIARLEAQHRVEESLPERALRLYGVVFADDLLQSKAPNIGSGVAAADVVTSLDRRETVLVPAGGNNNGGSHP